MERNIVILSDGTGQAGGLVPDENRSNVYKLYRATRVGPDSSIDPSQQLAYYDAGLGSRPPGGGAMRSFFRIIYNLVSQATGFGLTANIIDCYEMIIRLWRPGDRIFLFGFSRGAYTARCVGGVLANCGVPTRLEDGAPMKYDSATARRLAKIAVKKVYQHTASKPLAKATPRETELMGQRRELARQFRERYGVNLDDKSNYPFFIGVFDTVASVASTGALVVVAGIALALAAAAATLLWLFYPSYSPWFGDFVGDTLGSVLGLFRLDPSRWWGWFVFILGIFAAAGLLWYLKEQVKFAPSADPKRPWRTLSMSFGRMRFEDKTLNDNVAYARHAISIDEDRASFTRVGWGAIDATRPYQDAQGIITFRQYWFAGNHGDVGGSFPETESRLSDIALKWIVDAAAGIKDGLKIDASVLRLYPSSAGMQHDQRKVGFPVLTSRFGLTWKQKIRDVRTDATLHESVYERFDCKEVLHLDAMAPYRPENLRKHVRLTAYYGGNSAAALPAPPSTANVP
jgi:uncharacterized protein (DUF2235 family)